LVFIGLLIILLPLFLYAQGYPGQEIMKSNINNSVLESDSSMQELNSKLLDQYGVNNIMFVKFENGK
jgi:hypothetical protein